MSKIEKYSGQGKASEQALENRERLYKLFKNRPLPDSELLTNLGLYMRSGVLAKVMFINEIYEKIINIPGIIIEFGTWWGQSLILFENFRAIYEAYNWSRRIIGFDTFNGYPSVGERDKPSDVIKLGGYSTGSDYDKYLEELLDFHEVENVMSHIKKHQIIKGDVLKTVPEFFKNNPETIVALAYFDMALYEPSKACLQAIQPRLVKGSVIAFDEFNNPNYPGETLAAIETIGLNSFKIYRSRYLPDRAYVIVE